jgi:transposase
VDGEVDQSECYIDARFASAKSGGEQILHLEAKPENLIGDRAYDSDPPDEQLRSQGVEFIAPHKSNRVKRKTQYGRRLRRYERRWIIERFFAWIHGNVACWFDGSTTRAISPGLCGSQL